MGIGKRFENTLFSTGAALQLGPEIGSVTVGYEFRRILTGDLAVRHSWLDGSTLVQRTLSYSLIDNGDLIAGTAIGL